jgi:hypothetical protein
LLTTGLHFLALFSFYYYTVTSIVTDSRIAGLKSFVL